MGDYPALLLKCENGGDIGRGYEDVPRHSPQSARSRRERKRRKEKGKRERERRGEGRCTTDYGYTRSREGASRVEEGKGDLEKSTSREGGREVAGEEGGKSRGARGAGGERREARKARRVRGGQEAREARRER
jgi:hypothetical protein